MALAVILHPKAARPHKNQGGELKAYVQVTPSGSYVTNGDTLDLRGLSIPGLAAPYAFDVYSSAGYITHRYQFVAGTDRSNCKMVVLVNATGLELAAGAYAGGITGDTIICELNFKFPE